MNYRASSRTLRPAVRIGLIHKVKKMKLFVIYLLFFFHSIVGRAQEMTMTAEQQRLVAFKGHWTIEGSEGTYLEICDWIQGNHMACISTSKENSGVDSSVSYLSYSVLENSYIYYGLYSSGNSRTLRGVWEKDKFVFEGQRITPGKTTKWRVTMTPNDKGLRFVEETSVNNSLWEKKADFVYKRIP